MHEVQYFLAVCDTLNFNRAAERCHVSQPALTRAIQKLEDELGGLLFRRDRHGTRLTELGQLMRRQLGDVLHQADAAKATAKQFLLLEAAPMTLGVMCTIGPLKFIRFLNEFRHQRPGIQLTLVETVPSRLAELLLGGAADVALMAQPEPFDARLQVTPIYRERFVVAFPIGHRITVGVITLTTFWIAALATKGSQVHRRAGAVYLSLIAILGTAGLMLASRLSQGDLSQAVWIGLLIILLGTSAWLAWSAIRHKQSVALLTGGVYKTLASLNLTAGVVMVGLFFLTGYPLILILSSVGFAMGAAMWRLILRGPRDGHWWLEQHMNAAAVNFAATHDSFLALALRIWMGRRYLGARRVAGGASSERGDHSSIEGYPT